MPSSSEGQFLRRKIATNYSLAWSRRARLRDYVSLNTFAANVTHVRAIPRDGPHLLYIWSFYLVSIRAERISIFFISTYIYAYMYRSPFKNRFRNRPSMSLGSRVVSPFFAHIDIKNKKRRDVFQHDDSERVNEKSWSSVCVLFFSSFFPTWFLDMM